MGDDQQNTQGVQDQGSSQPVQQSQPQSASTQRGEQPVAPSGHGQKEIGMSSAGTAEYITPSAEVQQVEISKEVAEAGVEAVVEQQPLPPAVQKIGVHLAKEATPVSTTPSGAVQLPVTLEEAQRIVKKKQNPVNSIVWLALLIVKQFRKK